MNFQTFLNLMVPVQIESLLIQEGIKEKVITGIQNKGNNIFAFCVTEGINKLRRFIVKVDKQSIRIMGSYSWYGELT